MNILFFSQAAWDDKNSVGNTFSNFYNGDIWTNDAFFHMYARKKRPSNQMKICYYNISAVDIIKGILTGKYKASVFETDGSKEDDLDIINNSDERKQIEKLHRGKHETVYFVHEMIWKSGLWRDAQFERFIKDSSPDVLFAFATSPYILWPLIQYLKKHTDCKVVLLIADDVFGSYDQCAFYRKYYLKREFTRCIQAADKLYGISDEMSELYTKCFGKTVTTLYKGCDLSEEPKGYLNQPLRFVYAGNLFWGRDDTLAMVADALEKINTDDTKAILEIYTGASITDEMKKKLERTGTSQIMGPRPYEEIKRIMHEADAVLHVESFQQQAIDTVRYSFSTKIIDCLQSGNQVLAIGPNGIASIEYIRKIPGTIVIDNCNEIENLISHSVKNQEQFLENTASTRDFAQKYHELGAVQENLRKKFEELLENK